MTTKHTSGPWEASSPDAPRQEVYGSGYRVALMTGGEIGRDRASARLIAAAPDLLEAARLLPVGWLESGVLTSERADGLLVRMSVTGCDYEHAITIGELRAAARAIAKAEGRS